MNDEYLSYVQSLADLNSALITPGFMPEPQVFNAFAWGFIEEIEEYKAAGKDQKIKEAGDVLAYATLLILCIADVPETTEVLKNWRSARFKRLEFFSNLKRINREGADFDWDNVVYGWNAILRDAENVHSLTFADIARTNIAKLKDRADRKVMFSGSGDNR